MVSVWEILFVVDPVLNTHREVSAALASVEWRSALPFRCARRRTEERNI